MKKLKNQARNEIFRQISLTFVKLPSTLPSNQILFIQNASNLYSLHALIVKVNTPNVTHNALRLPRILLSSGRS